MILKRKGNISLSGLMDNYYRSTHISLHWFLGEYPQDQTKTFIKNNAFGCLYWFIFSHDGIVQQQNT